MKQRFASVHLYPTQLPGNYLLSTRQNPCPGRFVFSLEMVRKSHFAGQKPAAIPRLQTFESRFRCHHPLCTGSFGTQNLRYILPLECMQEH